MMTRYRSSLSWIFITVVALLRPLGVHAQQKDPRLALMSQIPAGDFLMGREDVKYDLLKMMPRDKDDDRPVHKVLLDAFLLDKFEVTNSEYRSEERRVGKE